MQLVGEGDLLKVNETSLTGESSFVANCPGDIVRTGAAVDAQAAAFGSFGHDLCMCQWGMHFALGSAAEHWCWVTAIE